MLNKQRTELLNLLIKEYELNSEKKERLQEIFANSPYLSQGNPDVTTHPLSESSCKEKWQSQAMQMRLILKSDNICENKYMIPVAPDGKKPSYCVDQFEFPNIPCQYPVVWIKANQAAQICTTLGKRLCDADEWENACGGTFPNRDVPPLAQESFNDWHGRQRKILNTNREIITVPETINCATRSSKSDECNDALAQGKGIWERCGSNTYPTGSFPECSLKFDVFDLQGNVAEHMNLPMQNMEKGRNGGIGYTEMKGSWFIFSTFKAHNYDCYWRAPYWHGTKVMDKSSHQNYHLGFRCCKDINN